MTSFAPYVLATFLSDTVDTGRGPLTARLRQAGVDDQILSGDAARLVGCQKECRARDVVFGKSKLQTLRIQKGPLLFRRQPQRLLPLGDDGAGNNRIDANVVHAEFA